MTTSWFDYLVFPLLLPFILVWILLARIISLLVPLTIIPCIILSKRLYWAFPIAPCIWRERGPFMGRLLQLGFEVTYCMNVARRFLTLPLRRYTPHVYILGFPKCGTTALAQSLMQHPAIAGSDGLPWHPVFSKESHFFNGVLGRGSAASVLLYRSFFPTVLNRWWREVVLRSGGFFCMDACPLTACLPYTARRIAAMNPDAKLIFLVRDPLESVFSAEIMLRNLGMDLSWSFMEDVRAADPRFAETPDDAEFWERLSLLGPEESLPIDLPDRLFGKCSAVLRCAMYADRIRPFLEAFPKQNIMFIELTELQSKPDEMIASILRFIGADPARAHPPLPPIVSGDRRGRRMHPAVRRKLQHFFAIPNQKMFAIMGKEYPWGEWVPTAAADEEEGGIPFPIIPVIQSRPGVTHGGARVMGETEMTSSRTNDSPTNGQPRSAGKKVQKSLPDLLPGAAVVTKNSSSSLGRKDSRTLVKRVVSISAKV